MNETSISYYYDSASKSIKQVANESYNIRLMGDLLVIDEFLIYRDQQLNYLYVLDRKTMIGTHNFESEGRDVLVYDIVQRNLSERIYTMIACTQNIWSDDNQCLSYLINVTL